MKWVLVQQGIVPVLLPTNSVNQQVNVMPEKGRVGYFQPRGLLQMAKGIPIKSGAVDFFDNRRKEVLAPS